MNVYLDLSNNSLRCRGCIFRQKLYSRNSLIQNQELAKAKAAHECPHQAKAQTLDEYWRSAFSGLS